MPSDTFVPTDTSNSRTMPATGEGTSMVALSDSMLRIRSSTARRSPGFTKSSMTGTSR